MPTYGAPVDELDRGCKFYRDCQRCAREHFGDTCIGEFQRYQYGEANGEKVCLAVILSFYTLFKFCSDDANTCKRSLCECDLAFAKWSGSAAKFYDEGYQWPANWAPEAQCSSGEGSGAVSMSCCSNEDFTKPFKWFNANKGKCCLDGSVKFVADSC